MWKPKSQAPTPVPQPSCSSSKPPSYTETTENAAKAKAQRQRTQARQNRSRAAVREAVREANVEEFIQQEEEAAREAKRRDTDVHVQVSARSWERQCAFFFADPTSESFPFPPSEGPCDRGGCVRAGQLGVCHHDVGVLFRDQDGAFLKRERLRWHPDRFAGRGGVQGLALEMFQLVQRLVDGDGGGELW